MIRSKEINYRFVERVDESLYNKIVDFHRTTFPTGIISSMGLDFIKSYYNELLHNKHCKMICAYDGDAVVGFIVYCEKPDLLRQETNLPVLKRKFYFM